MGFSRQEHWSGLPCPSPGDLPHPGIEPRSPALQADSLLFEPQESPFAFVQLHKWLFSENWKSFPGCGHAETLIARTYSQRNHLRPLSSIWQVNVHFQWFLSFNWLFLFLMDSTVISPDPIKEWACTLFNFKFLCKGLLCISCHEWWSPNPVVGHLFLSFSYFGCCAVDLYSKTFSISVF